METMKEAPEVFELRQRAEKELATEAESMELLSEMTPEKMASLIHELQVHQIELKMQNHELCRIQGELEKARDRYGHLYDFAPIGYLTMNQKGAIDEANLTFASMLGIARGALIGKPFTRFVLRDDQNILYKHRQRLLETGAPQSCELRLVKEDGQGFYARLECIVISNQIRGAVIDITDRLREQEDLRKSENFNKKIIESSADCIKTLDLDGRLQFMSEGGQKLLEIGDIGPYLNQSWIDFWKGPDHKAALEAISWAKEGNTGRFQGYCPTEKGTPKWWDVIITPVFDDDEKIERFIAVSRDITEKKQEEEVRRDLETQLQQAQKMEAIGTLAGGIAHDFNNILSIIIGYSELVLMETPEGGKINQNIQEVLAAGGRAKELVKQILTFARQSNTEVKPVQVKYILKEALKMLHASVPSSIEIRETIESDVMILADPTQIYQVIMNLCTNAVQAIKDEVGVMKVQLKEVSLNSRFTERHPNILPGGYLQLSVEDTGCGMKPDVLRKIFDPYFTTKGAGEGTGLGLSVIKGIVDRYKGTITVKSETGKGSTFDVYFPIMETNAGKPASKSEGEDAPTGDEAILVIDDELSISLLYAAMLTALGYRVTTRTSPIEAIDLFKSDPGRFDLVITDMTMPQMTGDLLALEMRKIKPDIPVILCTGYSKKISEEIVRATGINALLMKPVMQLEMAGTVRKVLDEAGSRVLPGT